MAEAQWLEIKARLESVEREKAELASQLEELRAGTDRRLRQLEAKFNTGSVDDQQGAVLVTPAEEPASKDPDIDDDPREYAVEESTWDAVLVCGNMTRAWETLTIVAGCLLNMVIQFLYCWIVYKTLAADSPVDEKKLKELAVWRMVIGHRAEHYDELTESSLVSRVCADSGFSIKSATQQGLHKELSDYQSFEGAKFLASPPMLCIISIFCWLVVAIKDFMRTFDCARALLSTPRAWRTRFVEVDGAVQLEALSMGRLLFVFVGVVLVKFAIVMIIGFLGVQYLVFTKKAEDLLLNAIALQFILEVDELLYTRFMPKRVSGILSRLKPLPINDRLRMPKALRRAFPFRAATVLVVAFVLVVVVFYSMLVPELRLVREGVRILCGGKTDFFYATDSATGAITISEDLTPKLNVSEMDSIFNRYTFRAVLQRTGLKLEETLKDVSESPPELFLNDKPLEVVELNRLSKLEANDRLACVDLVSGNWDDQAYVEAFQSTFGYASCTEIPYCDWDVRAFCPNSCGCDRYYYGHFDRRGCSRKCERIAKSDFESTAGKLRRNHKKGTETCKDEEDMEVEIRAYFAEVQEELILEEALIVNDSRSEGFVQFSEELLELVRWKTSGSYDISLDVNFDLGKWAEESYLKASAAGNEVKCNIVAFVFQLFDLDLCKTESSSLFNGRVGSIEAICIKTCGHCTEPRSTPYRAVDWPELYNWSSSALTDNPMQEFSSCAEEYC